MGGATSRILTELSVLEKALSTGDFGKQKPPLEEILKQLRPLRLRSMDDLDFNTRGRLLTTLLRVGRQKKPPSPPAAPTEGAPKAPPQAAEPAPPAGESEAAAPTAEQANAAEPQTEASAQPTPTPLEGTASAEGSVPAPAPPESIPTAKAPREERPRSPEEEKLDAYSDLIFLLGSVWKALGDDRRATLAIEASGRKVEERESPRVQREPGEWREEAQSLERQKRTRDAARIHERHQSYAEAARLFEVGGDLNSALRCLLAAKDSLSARRLLKQLKPEHFLPIVEKAGAYPLLMEHYVDSGDFDNVARLYERARQFDQAAIAWEKSGKLPAARKAYERAKDSVNAERVRQLEVEKLIQRGDRLGAALLQVTAGKREDAVQTLLALPSTKAFRFLQKLKLDAEALALAQKEIDRAESENKPALKARWLEMLGDLPSAAEAWERAERKDRALALYEQAANWPRAAELAEALGQREKAIELYYRAGDKTSADRVASLPSQVAAPPPSSPPLPLEGQGEER